jgi:hypothetical protein
MGDVTPPTAASLGTIQSVKNLIIANQLFQSTAEGLTAHAGGTQALATPINAMCVRFTTCATPSRLVDSAGRRSGPGNHRHQCWRAPMSP